MMKFGKVVEFRALAQLHADLVWRVTNSSEPVKDVQWCAAGVQASLPACTDGLCAQMCVVH